MKKLFTERAALYCLLGILSTIVIFHLLVLLGIIPYQIVWGGRLTDHDQMVRFETVSIAINLFMVAVVAVRAGIVKVRIKPLILTMALWLMCGLFLLNTIGNLLSTNAFERAVFTPLTLLLSLCCLRLALGNKWSSVSEKQ